MKTFPGPCSQLFALVQLVLAFAPCSTSPLLAKSGMGGGAIEAEAKSEYSHIRIRRQGNVRTMNFVRDNGEEHIQTLWNTTKRPYDRLVTNYSPPHVFQLPLHAAAEAGADRRTGRRRWSTSSSTMTPK